MKFNLSRVLSLVLCLLMLTTLLAACSNKDDEIPENMQYATVAGSHYRLFLPIDWNLLTDTGVSGGYASAQNKAVIYVKVYDNPEGLTADSYWSTVLMPARQASFEVMEPATSPVPLETPLDEHPALVMGYEGTRELVTYWGQDVICPKDDKIYVLTFCTRKDLYEGYLDTFEDVRKNFKFSDTPFEPKEPINTVDPDADAPEGMMLASSDDVAYRFFAPESWVVGDAEAAALVYASETDRSNVTVMGYAAPDGYSVANYWEDTEKYYKDTLKDYALTGDPVQSEMGGKRATVYEYTYSLGGVTYKCRQSICVFGYMIVVMTYTALPENYDAHMAEVEQMQAELDNRRGCKTCACGVKNPEGSVFCNACGKEL